jgi:hypothetical protein
MLRRVLALATVGVVLGSPAVAVDLITYPTLARGTLAFAPVPFATLNIDWLDTFAANIDTAERFTVSQLADFLSGTPATEPIIALSGPADITRNPDPPKTARRAFDKLELLDLE